MSIHRKAKYVVTTLTAPRIAVTSTPATAALTALCPVSKNDDSSVGP